MTFTSTEMMRIRLRNQNKEKEKQNMSLNLNKVILGGRLTADPELKSTPSGNNVTSFTIAIDRKFGKGEEKKTDFINCVAWRGTADFVTKYFSKGSAICVIGEIQTRSWQDNNGGKRYATEVIVSDVNFVDVKGQVSEENEKNAGCNVSQAAYPADVRFEELEHDDDIPF